MTTIDRYHRKTV